MVLRVTWVSLFHHLADLGDFGLREQAMEEAQETRCMNLVMAASRVSLVVMTSLKSQWSSMMELKHLNHSSLLVSVNVKEGSVGRGRGVIATDQVIG